MQKRQRFSSTQSLASQSSKGTYGKRTVKSNKNNSQRSLVNYNPKFNIPRWGFPRRLYIAHKYASTDRFESTLGVSTNRLFRCNGMFDPDLTGIGHQPMYFDNCVAIYDHYTVVKSYAKFTICPSTVSTSAALVACYVDDDASVATPLANMEMAGSTGKLIPPAQNEPTILTKSWSARSTFGGDPLSNDNLQGTGTTDPVEQSNFVISVELPGLVTQNFTLITEIIYYAIWDELKTQTIN